MLLDGEWPRIKGNAEQGNIRKITSPGFANGESQHLWNNLFSQDRFSNQGPKKGRLKRRGKKNTHLGNVDGGVSEEEELVRARNEDGPDETDDPSTEGRRRH